MKLKRHQTVYYTANLIASAQGTTERAVRKWAKENAISYIWREDSKNGCSKKLYKFDELPNQIQQKIIAAELGCRPEFVPSRKIDENRVKALLGRWQAAPKWNKSIAWGRFRILEAAEKFIRTKKLKQTGGYEVFAIYYNGRRDLNISHKIQKEIPKISTASMRRWRNRLDKQGLPGLLAGYGKRKGRYTAITPEMKMFITSQFSNIPHIRTSHLYRMMKSQFEKCPHRTTIDRFVKGWKKDNPQISAMLEDPQKWKNNFMPAFGDAAAGVDYFGHTWEMDSTPADVITSDHHRCAVIGCVDIFSRKAKLLLTPTSKSVGIAACMRKAILDWGVPDRIRMDNGQDYRSMHIDAVTSSLEIETPALPKYAGEYKPHIERFFGTFARGFEELVNGYCGHSVAERQAIRARKTWGEKIMESGEPVQVPLTMAEFQKLCDAWLKIYEATPHRSLCGKRPKDMPFITSLSPQKIKDERVLDVLLAPVERPRKVGKKGISVDREIFNAPELVDHIGKRVQCRRDLENAGLIYVFDATKGAFLCKATNEALSGETLESYQKMKKSNEKRIKERAKALKTVGLSENTPLDIILGDEIRNEGINNMAACYQQADTPGIREARKAVHGEVPLMPENKGKSAQIKNFQQRHNITDPLDESWKTEEEINQEGDEAIEYFEKRINSQIG